MMTDLLIIALTATSLGVMIFQIMTSPSKAEEFLFQIAILGTGVGASWLFAQSSSMRTMRGRARPVFRRVQEIYLSQYNLLSRIREFKNQRPDNRLDVIEAIVSQQLTTVMFAIEDWRDMVPEDVENIEAQAREFQNDNPS